MKLPWFSRRPYRAKVKNLLSTILYEEGDRRMEIDGEPLGTEEGHMLVYMSTMKWKSPHDGERLSSQEKDRIRRNVEEVLGVLRIKWVDD